ncbi:nucleotidyltransferase [Helcococcus kunzii]|uniref:nucleotidyltransferase family protein n=1 Tax=Helcococcus kunzii TaxID=40091 RepID=UPI001C97D3D9|nr:sugar phosphate nucleotidyltransferase [Helcococcus kunzii]QZO75914.1 nucleotidyltransferase [Helcococcus kunzii]
MKKPVLVIMAAGMSSRYGSLKQIDPIDKEGNVIIDFSIYDAIKAGFEKVIFIIKEEMLSDFKEVIGDKVSKHIDVEYAFQDLRDIPAEYEIPEGRVKPWGTAHAIYSARKYINGTFAVINADDYYGREAFKKIYDFLVESENDDKYNYAMIGYRLYNTVTENGTVSRGICEVNEDGFLDNVTERTKIAKFDDGIRFTEDDGNTWCDLDSNSYISMNMWGLNESFIEEIEKEFPSFFEHDVKKNPLKAEIFIPKLIANLLERGKVRVKVLPTDEKWHGVTYKEDKPIVEREIQKLKDKGLYSQDIWSE